MRVPVARWLALLPLLAVASGAALDWHRATAHSQAGDYDHSCAAAADHDHHEPPSAPPPPHSDGECGLCYMLAAAAAGALDDAPLLVTKAPSLRFSVPAAAAAPRALDLHRPAAPRAPPVA